MWTLFGQQIGDLNLGVLLAGTATGGGVWFVIRLIYRYQRDFTDQYSQRIVKLEARIVVLETDRDRKHKQLIACATERGALRAVVRQAGIEWRPEDWGALPDDAA